MVRQRGALAAVARSPGHGVNPRSGRKSGSTLSRYLRPSGERRSASIDTSGALNTIEPMSRLLIVTTPRASRSIVPMRQKGSTLLYQHRPCISSGWLACDICTFMARSYFPGGRRDASRRFEGPSTRLSPLYGIAASIRTRPQE
jgi:hypothetical protein